MYTGLPEKGEIGAHGAKLDMFLQECKMNNNPRIQKAAEAAMERLAQLEASQEVVDKVDNDERVETKEVEQVIDYAREFLDAMGDIANQIRNTQLSAAVQETVRKLDTNIEQGAPLNTYIKDVASTDNLVSRVISKLESI